MKLAAIGFFLFFLDKLEFITKGQSPTKMNLSDICKRDKSKGVNGLKPYTISKEEDEYDGNGFEDENDHDSAVGDRRYGGRHSSARNQEDNI